MRGSLARSFFNELSKFRDGLQRLVTSRKNTNMISSNEEFVEFIGTQDFKNVNAESLITHLGGFPGSHKVKLLPSKVSSGRSLRRNIRAHVFKAIYGKVMYASNYGCVDAVYQRIKSALFILDLALLPLKASSKCCSAAAWVAGLKSSRLSSNHPRRGRENSPEGSVKILLVKRRPRERFLNKIQSLIAQRSALASASSSMLRTERSRSLIASWSILGRRFNTNIWAMAAGSSNDFFFWTFLSHFIAGDNSPTTNTHKEIVRHKNLVHVNCTHKWHMS